MYAIRSYYGRNIDVGRRHRCFHMDITDRKRIEEERDQLIASLQEALQEIRTLKGIIPICSYCRRIRDEEGAWDKLEEYLARHSNAEFSHGICPDCYVDVMEKIEQKKNSSDRQ